MLKLKHGGTKCVACDLNRDCEIKLCAIFIYFSIPFHFISNKFNQILAYYFKFIFPFFILCVLWIKLWKYGRRIGCLWKLKRAEGNVSRVVNRDEMSRITSKMAYVSAHRSLIISWMHELFRKETHRVIHREIGRKIFFGWDYEIYAGNRTYVRFSNDEFMNLTKNWLS